MCKLCGGLDGAHGLVHVRFEQGGGGMNRPCPASPDSVRQADRG